MILKGGAQTSGDHTQLHKYGEAQVQWKSFLQQRLWNMDSAKHTQAQISHQLYMNALAIKEAEMRRGRSCAQLFRLALLALSLSLKSAKVVGNPTSVHHLRPVEDSTCDPSLQTVLFHSYRAPEKETDSFTFSPEILYPNAVSWSCRMKETLDFRDTGDLPFGPIKPTPTIDHLVH